jgi:uncharacterized protein YjaG (DUF416 family)
VSKLKSNAQQSLDAVTDGISAKLKRLPSRHVALFSACVAERLSGFYDPFLQRHGIEDRRVIRDALDAIWQFLTDDRSTHDLRKHLAEIERATPASEDYDSIESVLAQHLCIVVDSAIRSCLRERDGGLVAGEFGIELLRVAVLHVRTGFVDLGSGPRAKELEATLITHPLIATEVMRQHSDLRLLEATSFISSELLAKLKSTAEGGRVDVSQVFLP